MISAINHILIRGLAGSPGPWGLGLPCSPVSAPAAAAALLLWLAPLAAGCLAPVLPPIFVVSAGQGFQALSRKRCPFDWKTMG